MIVWVFAGLLAVATGLRIGWGLVNRQSLVSAAMVVALASLGVVAALNWPPLATLVNTLANWPNISVGLSQVALICCAAGSSVMITAVSSSGRPVTVRRSAWLQYCVAALLSLTTLAMFIAAGKQLELAPADYLRQHLGSAQVMLPWALTLFYVFAAGSAVSWTGFRHSSASRRGRALFVFTVGIVLLVVAAVLFLIIATGAAHFVGVGSAVTVLSGAMLVVAVATLSPAVEDWLGARREVQILKPMLRELLERQPNVGIGVRPRGPLVYRAAEGMAAASDALLLEATVAELAASDSGRAGAASSEDGAKPKSIQRPEPAAVSAEDRAHAIAEWIIDRQALSFPGLDWLTRPDEMSDREWILAIAQQFRAMQWRHHDVHRSRWHSRIHSRGAHQLPRQAMR